MSRIWRALAAVLLLTFCLVPPAAEAAPSAEAAPTTAADPELSTHLGRITLAPGGVEKTTVLWLRVVTDSEADRHFAVSVDYGDAAGFATVDLALAFGASAAAARGIGALPSSTSSPGTTDDVCEHTGTVFSCAWDWYFPQADLTLPIGFVSATPSAGAAAGDEGTVTVTAKVDDTTATDGSTIQVGTPVDLAAVAGQEVDAAPGKTASFSPAVSNPGTTAVDGAVLVLEGSPALLGATSYSNCRYGDELVMCTFDTAIAAGTSYVLAEPFSLTPPADSIPGSVGTIATQWLTGTEYDDYVDIFPGNSDEYLGTPGTGDALDLTESTSAADTPQSDVNSENDAAAYELTVTGGTAPDLAAIGATYAAKVGEQLDIEVGLRNNGPGSLHPEIFDNNAVTALVRLPANTSALAGDDRCNEKWSDDDKDDDKVEYLCTLDSALTSGAVTPFGFALLVEKRAGTAGTVEVTDALASTASSAGVRAASSADNTAQIVVTATGGGVLPITGPDAARIAAAGLALILIGLLLTVRRSRRPVGAHARGNRGRVRRREGSAR